MDAKLARSPNRKATFSYSPQGDSLDNVYTLDFVGEIREEWVITGVDPDDDSIIDVAQCPDLPQPGDTADFDEDWMVARLEDLHDTGAIDQNNDNQLTYKCTVVYLPDPSQMPTEVHFGSNRVMQVVTADVDSGAAIVNGAGDPYNPPVQEARAILRIKIIKRYLNDDSFGGDTIQNFADHMSSADWDIPGLGTVPAGDAFCIGIEAPLVKEPIWHLQAEFNFEIDTTNIVGEEGEDVGFRQSLLNCGYQFKDANGKKTVMCDDHGISHGGIGLLKDDGTKADPSSPVYDTWHTKPEADFNDLSLFGV